MKHKALGKGLRSLIPEAPARVKASGPVELPQSKPADGYLHIDIDTIRPNREQPRQSFDEEQLEQLAHSLKEQGVLQPVIVRPADGGGYELIAGERRWRAAQRAGLLKIPAVIRQVSDDHLLELALIENLQRQELNPLEEAAAFQTLIDELGLTQQDVAERVGKQRSTVANTLRLLQLPATVREKVRSGQISLGHAKALASLGSPGQQSDIADRIVREGLSVRQTEAMVGRLTSPAKATSTTSRLDPNVDAAEQSLQRSLGTKVRIFQGKKGGRIEIYFYSHDELERVYQHLAAIRTP